MQKLAAGCLAVFVTFSAHDVGAAAPDCEAQKQVDVAKIAQQVVLIGEVHGTREIPAFTAGLVCSLLENGKSVILAVEHDGEEQDAMNRYLASSGSAADRQAILQGRTWKTYSDGRGSVAMFDLVESMRRLRQAGRRVGVLTFRHSDNLVVPMEAADRVVLAPDDNALENRLNDLDMASSIQYAAILYRRYVVVVLTGYSHASTVLSRSTDPMFGTYRPMGQIVDEAMPTFVIGLETGGGEHAFMDKARAIEAGALSVTGTRIDARVRLDRLTPSFPARDAVTR